MDTRRLPPALLMALGLAGCGGDDDGGTTGPCLDIAPMTSTGTDTTTATTSETDPSDTSTSACLEVEPMTTSSTSAEGSGSDSDSGDSTSLGPCLDAPPPTSTSGDESSGGSTGAGAADDRDEVVRTLVGRGILPDDVAAKLGGRQRGGD